MPQVGSLGRFSQFRRRSIRRWGLALGCCAVLAILFAGPFLWRYWLDWQFARDIATVGGTLDIHYDNGPIFARMNGCGVLLGECDVDDLWLTRHRAALGELGGRLFLELRGTSVGDAGLAQLIGLDLQSLSLDSTQVTDEGLSQFAKFVSIKYLSLGNTQVTNAGLPSLQRIPDLRSVGLDSTQVTDDGLSHLLKITRLEGLSLYDTPVTDGGLARLQEMPCLRTLTVGGPRITDDTVAVVGQLPSLVYLRLRDAQITDTALRHLNKLPLSTLVLDSTPVSVAGLAKLAQLSRLDSLCLINMPITDEGLQQLKVIARLRWLYLRGTRVTTAGAAALRNALPACQITLD